MPKGAVLTHDNLTFTAQTVYHSFQTEDGDVTLLFLPLAHVFARTCVFTALFMGATTVFARGVDTLSEDFQIARPHWFPSVPRVYEKIHTKIISGAQAKGGLALKIFNWAVKVGSQVSDLKLAKKPIPPLLGMKYGLATKLVFSKVQGALGGRVRWCISGAAPINPNIAKFFHCAGVLVLEGIGMTENTSFTNINRFDDYRFGWVGPTGPGIEQRTGDDGEVLYRGRNVMREYYKMPAETAETLTSDGWQLTGDLGEIDDVGFLRITGRKKDLIVTAGGKNVAPSAIEGLIATSKYISQRRGERQGLCRGAGYCSRQSRRSVEEPGCQRPHPLGGGGEEHGARILRDHQGLPPASRVLDRERPPDPDPQGQTERRNGAVCGRD